MLLISLLKKKKMARKKIPHKDRELIKKRLAQGESQRKAIEGTVVEHHTTAGNIAKRELADISLLREKYIALIEKERAGDIDRAKLWADMTRATKVHTSHTEPDREVPDWNNREKALKYIDSLKEYPREKAAQQTQAQQTNVYVQAQKDADRFIVEEEAKD